MRIIVTRNVDIPRLGTPLTFQVGASPEPQVLPHDIRDSIIRIGAGHAVPHVPGDSSGGLAAFIERKRRSA